MGENIFIVACVERNKLKMVKIRVTGETTFEWMEAKKQDVTTKCKAQETFTAECFVGTSVQKSSYNVVLVAKQQERKRNNLDIGKN